MQQPKITVITPTYNRADLIAQTIESVLAQTFADFEYYILDDGSTDNTEEVVQPYLKDERVKYFKHQNAGEAATANWGWQLAKGEYFTQVNSDDPILPTLFEEMVKALDENPDKVLAYPDFYFIDENNNVTFETKSPDWDFLTALSNYACYAASAGTFIRKSSFSNWETIKDSPYKHINDIDMYWKMALVGDFLHVPKTLANWRVHSGQISNKRYLCIPELFDWFHNYFNQPNLPQEVKNVEAATKRSLKKYMIELIQQSEFGQDELIELIQQPEFGQDKLIEATNNKKTLKHRMKKLTYQLFIRPFLSILYGKSRVKVYCDKIIE